MSHEKTSGKTSGKIFPGSANRNHENQKHENQKDVKAVVDIGSNSIKLRVACKIGAMIRTLIDTTEVVRLGKGLEHGLLAEDAIERGVYVVENLVCLAERRGAKPRLVGTMALRTARNSEDFVRQVREATGIEVEILSGEEEARLAWLGAIYSLNMRGKKDENVIVFDSGGGSTEFILGSNARILESISVPIGAVRLTEKFFDSDPVKPKALKSAQKYVRGLLAEYPFCRKFFSSAIFSSAIGLGGGVVAIASVKLGLPVFLPETLSGIFLTKADIDQQVERYASATLAERMQIPGLPPKRADIVLGSACIVQCALEALKADSFRVSINGLRHGLLLEMFAREMFEKKQPCKP
ncbi:MAG: Ppx/GppA family phosphatase [Synergistaceae bacterium]|nr:Ppx/GppA family phosphatase [Synergistaceae bacterium]